MPDQPRVIVLGASAGGVTALLSLVPKLSPRLAAPLLLVLHIGRHRSQLPELLGARGPLPAEFAHSGVVPRPGHIYVAPPDLHLLLEDGVLRLFNGPKEQHARPAIDPLFRSAALDRGPAVVGVILTGQLDDGSAGLRAVKACGGTAVVQDPRDAEAPSMPRSALASVSADHVVELDALPALLQQLAQPLAQPVEFNAPQWLRIEHAVSLGRADMTDLATIATPSRLSCPDCGGVLFEMGKPLRFLCHTGHAFSLRNLALNHGERAEEALWTALRAAHEKAEILRRLARLKAAEAPGSDAAILAEAEQAAAFGDRMRSVLDSAPTHGDIAGVPHGPGRLP